VKNMEVRERCVEIMMEMEMEVGMTESKEYKKKHRSRDSAMVAETGRRGQMVLQLK
jgi:hypothetical protein